MEKFISASLSCHKYKQQGCVGGGGSGELGLLSSKKMLSGGGPNYSSLSKLLMLINIQYFHIPVCRTKICNRDYLKHCSGNVLLFSVLVFSCIFILLLYHEKATNALYELV